MEAKSLVYRINDGQGPEMLSQVFMERGWMEFETEKHGEFDWNIWWRTSRFRQCDYEQIMPWQRLNHYPKSTGITKKDSLARHLKRMKGVYGASVFNFSPIAFNLPNDYTKYVAEYTKLRQGVNCKNLLWICKPADLSRGRGINIFRDLSELQYDCNAVVQRYITNPLLIGGYKFDIRIYVAVPCFHPLSVYIYQEGMVRFGTDKFDLTNLRNVFAHLTNTSINKHSPNYSTDKERIGPGCKWTLSQLRYYFHQNCIDDDRLWKRVANIVILTAMMQAPMVPKVDNCFELYGFDILIDENLKPWLLEVNFSPSLNCDCQVDVLVKKPMLHDLMDMMNFKSDDVNFGGEAFFHHSKNKYNSGSMSERTGYNNRMRRATSLQKLPILSNSSRMAPLTINLEGGSSFLRMAEADDAELKPIFGLPLANQSDEGYPSDNDTDKEINNNNTHMLKTSIRLKSDPRPVLHKSASSSNLLTLSAETSRTRESTFYDTRSIISERSSARKHVYKLHKVLSKGSSISDSGISSFSGSSDNSDINAKFDHMSKPSIPTITKPVFDFKSYNGKTDVQETRTLAAKEMSADLKPVKKLVPSNMKKFHRTPFKSVSQLTTANKTYRNAFAGVVPHFHVGELSESDDTSQTSTVSPSPHAERRKSHVAVSDTMKKAAARIHVRSLNSGPSSLTKRTFNGTRKAPLKTSHSQFTFSKPSVPKGPKEVIGEFYLVFPFNEVTRKTAVVSLDARVIIRETQKLLLESTSKVASTGTGSGSFLPKVPKLWGPVKNVEST